MIFRIFKQDCKEIGRSIFTLVIAVGVCVLGGLYAWANIYSNWDPYGRTKGLKMAVVSLDKGTEISSENGSLQNQNLGEQIEEKLHRNDKIDWVFLSSEKEAKEGVRSGEYYGAILIEEDFSKDMMHVFTEGGKQPRLVFYQNQKKNAIANKITDTVVTTIQSQLNEQFVELMAQRVMEEAGLVSREINSGRQPDHLESRLEQLRRAVTGDRKKLDQLIVGSQTVNQALRQGEGAANKAGEAIGKMNEGLTLAQEDAGRANLTVDEYSTKIRQLLDQAVSGAVNFQEGMAAINDSSDTETIQKAIQTHRDVLEKLEHQLRALGRAIPASQAPHLHQAIGQVDRMKENLEALSEMNPASWVGKTQEQLTEKEKEDKEKFYQQMDQVKQESRQFVVQLTGVVPSEIESAIIGAAQTIEDARGSLDQTADLLGGTQNIFSALAGTIGRSDVSLLQLRNTLLDVEKRLSQVSDAAKKLDEKSTYRLLRQTFTADPKSYGQFFANPVQIQSEVIDPVENYGSAVAPFYSVLSIWVTGLLLGAVMKTHPEAKRYPGAKPHQLYLGRFLIFVTLEQFFVLLLVLGDLFVLHIQCLHPVAFWEVCAVTGIVFSLLIFSLIYTFGSVGKAAAVVIVVLQIAGSSGTYPIEILPDFFRQVYLFFPFPYAINALRECVAGFYKQDLFVYLGKLLLFIPVALAIGIWVRKPTAKLLSFMEKRMEDTQLM